MSSKLLLPILLSGVCLACTRDTEETRPQVGTLSPITFSGNITHITESKAILEGAEMPNGATIGIYAWGHDKTNAKSDSTLRKDLSNSLYTKSAGNTFTSTTDAHYPVNPDTLLNIYAYYPYKADIADIHNIPFNLSDQNDLLVATPVMNRGKESAEQSVNLSFNHLLSAVTLKIKKADSILEDMILQSVSLENYPSSIRLDAVAGIATAVPSDTNYVLSNGGSAAITPAETTIISEYLLFAVAKPVFIIRLSGKDYRVESSKAFISGTKQTYVFTIQAGDITVSATIQPWADGGSTDEDIIY